MRRDDGLRDAEVVGGATDPSELHDEAEHLELLQGDAIVEAGRGLGLHSHIAMAQRIGVGHRCAARTRAASSLRSSPNSPNRPIWLMRKWLQPARDSVPTSPASRAATSASLSGGVAARSAASAVASDASASRSSRLVHEPAADLVHRVDAHTHAP